MVRYSTTLEEERRSQPTSSVHENLLRGSRSILFKEKLRTAYHKRELCPFDLRVWVSGGKSYSMHKDLFLTASPVFECLLRNVLQLSGDAKDLCTVKLQIEPNVFKVIRSFLYTDELPLDLPMNETLRLLEISVQYHIDLLVSRLVSFVQREITPNDSFKVLQTARNLELQELEEVALNLIWLNAEQLLTCPEFNYLGSYDVSRILSSDALCCDEINVFNAALRWAENKALHCENSKRALKYYFTEVAMSIRFPLMSPMELAYATLNEDIFEKDDIIKLFQFVCLPDSMKELVSTKYTSKYRSCSMQENSVNQKISRETQTDEIPAIVNGSSTIMSPNQSISRSREIVSVVATDVTSTVKESCSPTAKRIRLQTCDSDSDAEDLFTVVKKLNDRVFLSFEDLARRFYKEENKQAIGGFDFTSITLENNYRTMLFKNCTNFKLEANCMFMGKANCNSDSTFLDFVSHFDPMRYILFNTNSGQRMIAENIWSLNENILLKLNGITFLNVKHSKGKDVLVLNYISDSKKILSNLKLKPTVLALSNCEFSVKLVRERCKQLEKLILYRVWGEYTLEEIIRDFPNLTELVCWKYIHANWMIKSNFSVPLCFNLSNTFSAKSKIRKIVLFRAELKFPSRCSGIATSVTELVLDACCSTGMDMNAHISENFHYVFPSLETLAILENDYGSLASSSLVNCVRSKIQTIRSILVEGMKWSGEETEDVQLSSFLTKKANLSGKPKNYELKKLSDEKWIGIDMDESSKESTAVDGGYWSEKDKLEYQFNSLYHFYDSFETYQDYFEQTNFPKPTLWI